MGNATAYPKQFAITLERMLADPSLTEQSQRRFSQIAERFFAFLDRGFGIDNLQNVEQPIAEAFINARLKNGDEPELATRHLRRATLRLLFQAAEFEGFVDIDPTRKIELPSRSFSTFRALTEDEIVLCRSFAQWSSRHATIWALAEATATTSESPNLLTSDIDLDCLRIWLHDGAKTTPRFGQLSKWGASQIEQRHKKLTKKRRSLLVGSEQASQVCGQASVCVAIRQTIIAAGLGDEAGVRPASIAAWAGLAIYNETSSIEETARRLGFSSLDRTARFVGVAR